MGDATEVTMSVKDDDDIPSVITRDSVELNFNANNSKDNEIEINETGGSQMEAGDQGGIVLSIDEDNTVRSCVSADDSTPSALPTSQNMEIANGVLDVETKPDVAVMDNATIEGIPEVGARQTVSGPCETIASSNVQVPDAYDSLGIESIEILQSDGCVTESSQTQPTSSYNWGSDQINDPFAQVTMEQIIDKSAVSNSDEVADAVKTPQITPDVFVGPSGDFGQKFNRIVWCWTEKMNKQMQYPSFNPHLQTTQQ